MPGQLAPLDGMSYYALSADGSMVTYSLQARDRRNTQQDAAGKLYTSLMYQSIVGSEPVSIWTDYAVIPAWRPDGAAVAHTTSDQDLVISDLSGHTLLSIHPGPPHKASSLSDNITEIRWDPNGKRLAFIMGILSEAKLYLVNADGSDLRAVVFRDSGKHERNVPIYHFAWSPDGHKLVFRTTYLAGKKCNYDISYKLGTGSFPCAIGSNLFTSDADGTNLNRITSKFDYGDGELFWIQ
jgi:Tol biopolymer transport system component